MAGSKLKKITLGNDQQSVKRHQFAINGNLGKLNTDRALKTYFGGATASGVLKDNNVA